MGADGSKNSKLWQDVFTEDTKESAAVTKTVLGTASKAGQLTPQQLQELAESELKKFEGQRKLMFDKIFVTYDTNKDNSLDDKETKALMKECLVSQKAYLPATIDSIYATALSAATAMLKGSMTAAELKETENLLKTKFTGMKKKVIANANIVMDKMISESDSLAEAFFKKMDENNDKKISREEFAKHYDKASGEVMNKQVLTTLIQQSLGSL